LVVLGDALLDIDLVGTADRLTPDAPVPVLDHLEEVARPGGAALAAAMAARDGHDVVLVTALGDDEAGRRIEELLPEVAVHRLPYDGPTAVKTRIRADGQSVVRLDQGTEPGEVCGLPDATAAVVRGAGAVLVADYGRGTTAEPAVRRLLTDLAQHVPVTWDPHPRGSEPVPGVRLVTPNRAEIAHFARRSGVPDVPASTEVRTVSHQAAALLDHWQAHAVAVTLGSRGALLTYGDGAPVLAPAPAVNALDPCGAGDRFAVTAATDLGSGVVTAEAVQHAVLDAAAYVGAGGPASLFGRRPEATPGLRTSPEQLAVDVAQRGGVVVATGGCFDLLHAGHVATLRAARRLGDCLIVCLNSDASVRRLKGESRPLVPAADRARVLDALEFVDAVIEFDEDTPVQVLRRIRPHVWAKGGDYAGRVVPEAAVLEEWGGQAVVLPYLAGRSTTRLVDTARQSGAARELRQTDDTITKESAR
jgi:rfaE bifunctional protein nucleotidyltransferase chain/domain/rfaE bifunctional protein kinase chain/domain